MAPRHDISWIKAYAMAIASLLSGAAVVHNIFKPDLVMPAALPMDPDLALGQGDCI